MLEGVMRVEILKRKETIQTNGIINDEDRLISNWSEAERICRILDNEYGTKILDNHFVS